MRARAAGIVLLLVVALGAARFAGRGGNGWPTGCGRAPANAPRAEVDEPPTERPTSPSRWTGCAPHARRECDAGDVYWFDGCGHREAIAERCGERFCDRDRCEPPPSGPRCADERPPLSEEGRCEGETLVYCAAGVVRRRDCRLAGGHCGHDEERGTVCLPGLDHPCEGIAASGACVGGVLVRCLGDRPVRVPCVLRGGRCEVDSSTGEARCVRARVIAAPDPTDRCAACGCAPHPPAGEEVCDGFDNDGNGLVDDGIECPPLGVLAFIVRDAAGRTTDSADRVRDELARLAETLRAPGRDTGIDVNVIDVRTIDRPGWFDADRRAVDQAAADPEIDRAVDGMYVPIVFVRRLDVGGKEVAGVGTLPNGTCADLELPHSGQRERGVVVVGRGRAPTTLAHELGHFLGLCHTHQAMPALEVDRPVVQSARGASDETLSCPSCGSEGDGICDTPADPGAEGGCVLDEARCTAECGGRASPDVTNIMSYYKPCRRWFSVEQAVQMRRYLWRRTLWRSCPGAPEQRCSCDPDAAPESSCGGPATLRRCERTSPAAGDAGGACRLAGSRDVGGPCRADLDCRAGLVCASGPEASAPLCRRRCTVGGDECACLPGLTGGTLGGCPLP